VRRTGHGEQRCDDGDAQPQSIEHHAGSSRTK
jgi:hypothetical protein